MPMSLQDPGMIAQAATLRIQRSEEGALTLLLKGRLDSSSTGALWREATKAARTPEELIVDATGVTYCDLSGIGLLVDLRRRQAEAGRPFLLRGLPPDAQRLLDLFADRPAAVIGGAGAPASAVERIGKAAWGLWSDLREMIVFFGALSEALWLVATRRQRIRWKDTLMVAESAGLNALPVICLMGGIMGLIIAFQGAIPLKRYGGEILVADMVVLSMFREIGPLFTAIMLAARSASAFAAELGTMKVSEEVDALTTMGIDPVVFLAVPRVTAGVLVTPLLTTFMNFCGLIGGGVVFLMLGFPAMTYVQRIMERGNAADFASGLVRSVVFGVIVAGVGCMQGLHTGKGARAVGESTTRSVVSTVVLIIIADGLLAVVFNVIGV